MQVGFLQYSVTRNREQNIEQFKRCLAQHQCDIVVLPELSMCGYLFESRAQLAAFAEPVPDGDSTRCMLQLSRQYACTIIFGLAEQENRMLFNTAVIVSNGRYVGKYRKIHLTDFEKRFFDRGSQNTVFDVNGIKIGVQICFDLWFPEISREQIRQGAQLLCALANFGGETTYHICKMRAIENLTPLVLCNRVGSESIPGMTADFLGKSTIVDAVGQRLHIAPEHAPGFAACDIPPAQSRANLLCSDFDAEMGVHYQEQPVNGGEALPEEDIRITMADIRAYIEDKKAQARAEGRAELTLKANDIHKALQLKNRMPMVCNAMRQCMGESDAVLHDTASGYSSTLKIRYRFTGHTI